MPVTKTAKRALRVSGRQKNTNSTILKNLEMAIRMAKKSKKTEEIKKAISLSDRAAKKRTIHKNKAARIKSMLSKLAPTKTKAKKATKKLPKKSKK